MILIVYTYYKTDVLLQKKNVDILSAISEGNFDGSEIFGAKQGLNIAAAVYDPTKFEPIDRKYGRIRFSKFSWGL